MTDAAIKNPLSPNNPAVMASEFSAIVYDMCLGQSGDLASSEFGSNARARPSSRGDVTFWSVPAERVRVGRREVTFYDSVTWLLCRWVWISFGLTQAMQRWQNTGLATCHSQLCLWGNHSISKICGHLLHDVYCQKGPRAWGIARPGQLEAASGRLPRPTRMTRTFTYA